MKTSTFVAATVAAGLLIGGAGAAGLIQAVAKPVAYKLPPETATLRPGPNQDVAAANCTGCHSADYIATQPRGAKFKEDFWKAEVTKMVKVYGAPIDDADVPKIVEYLTRAYADGDAPATSAPAPAGAAAGKPAPSASR